MQIVAHPDWLEGLPKSALSGVSSNARRVTAGSTEVIVNPAFEDVDDTFITSEVDRLLGSCDLTDKLKQIEESNKLKMGPRSIAKPWDERREGVYDYFKHDEPDLSAFGHESKLEVRDHVRPVSFRHAEERLIRSSTSGLPKLQRKGNLIPLDEAEILAEAGVYPCMLYTRTQESGKTRPVWGYPLSDTILEGMYFYAFLPIEKMMSHRAALSGPEAVDLAITQAMFDKRNDDKIFSSVDFSAYDASVTPGNSRKAFEFIASHFQARYHQDLRLMWERFCTIPLMTPDGELNGWHGVPSGSTWTNTVDSLAQHQASQGEGVIQIQGDDGVYAVHDVEELYGRFREAGFNINEDKSDHSDTDLTFLQRYYHPKYTAFNSGNILGGVYSLHRAMLRIKYLERWTNFKREGLAGRDFFTLRTLMILENVKHHPGFVELVKFVRNLDKTNLQFDPDSIPAFSRMLEAKSRAGVINSTVKGIMNFDVVKVLNTL